jgi:pimeloyl-ACP methyl ester carboxylesterase
VIAQRTHIAVLLVSLALPGCRESGEPNPLAAANPAMSAEMEDTDAGKVLTIEHAVPIISTVPANVGQAVELSVQERVLSKPGPRKAVLMVHGLSVPVLPGAALDVKHYDWSLELAEAGFDVFMVDFQGSGRSPSPDRGIRWLDPVRNESVRILDDPCNVPANQRGLIPHAACTPSYPFQLVTSQSDLYELDQVVDYIRAQRGVDKVALISWSHGAVRVGPYAADHSDKVESVLFYAPFYNPAAPAARPGTGPGGFGPPIDPATNAPFILPQPGTPMTLTTRSTYIGDWNRQIGCEGQVEDGIQDAVWSAIMDNDPIGRTWNPPEGAMRVRTFLLWGWNAVTVRRISVPTLIIGGEFDQGVPATLPQLYEELTGVPNDHRLLFTVQCAGHQLVWERQRRVLHHISKQWIKHGAVEGYTTGKFFVDTEGVIRPH